MVHKSSESIVYVKGYNVYKRKIQVTIQNLYFLGC